MKNCILKKLFSFIVIGLACISTMLQAASDTLIVGTNAEFPPFTYIENNTIVGFDIDIAKEVALHLGKNIQLKDMPFDALIPSIILGNVDFVAAGMSYTDERAKRVLFTKPYLTEDPLIILTTKNQDTHLDDLKGKTVVVIEGFTADLFMSSKDGINLIRLPTQADGFLALKSGRADAFVTARSTVNAFFDKQNASQFHTTIIEGTGETCALVVPKSKAALLVEIQNALDVMERDGTLTKLKTKWKLQ